MQKLTKAEEEIMNLIWDYEPCTVTQLIDKMSDPKPPHSSISSIVRILEKKEFVDHESQGRSYAYFSTVHKSAYSKYSLKVLVSRYFEGSMNNLVSFLVKEEDLTKDDLDDIAKQIER